MSYTINSGVGQWDKSADLEWRLKQMQDDMKFMWNRLTDLEVARDEKDEPYDVMDSFRATKKIEPDTGEPVNKHYIECLKQNARLIEENDVLRYQYEAMKNETVRCKEQIERFRQTLQLIVDHPAGPVGKVEYWEIGAKDMIWLAAKALKESK